MSSSQEPRVTRFSGAYTEKEIWLGKVLSGEFSGDSDSEELHEKGHKAILRTFFPDPISSGDADARDAVASFINSEMKDLPVEHRHRCGIGHDEVECAVCDKEGPSGDWGKARLISGLYPGIPPVPFTSRWTDTGRVIEAMCCAQLRHMAYPHFSTEGFMDVMLNKDKAKDQFKPKYKVTRRKKFMDKGVSNRFSSRRGVSSSSK